MEGGGLRVAMDDCYLGGFHLLDLVSYHQVFSATLGTHHDERVSFHKPRLNHCDVPLDSNGSHDWRQVLVLEAFQLGLPSLRSERHPALSRYIILVQQKVLRVRGSLSRKVENELCQLIPDVQREVTAQTLDAGKHEVALSLDVIHVAEGVVDDSDLGCLNHEVLLPRQGPVQGLHEDVVD